MGYDTINTCIVSYRPVAASAIHAYNGIHGQRAAGAGRVLSYACTGKYTAIPVRVVSARSDHVAVVAGEEF